MRGWIASSAFATVFLLAGCDAQHLMRAFAPTAETDIGQRYVEDVRARNFAPVQQNFDSKYQSQIIQGLGTLASMFPADSPKSIKLIGSSISTQNGTTTYNLTYEYEFPQAWFLAQIILRRFAGDLKIEGIHLIPILDSLEHANKLTLVGKTPTHHLVLLMAALSAMLTIGTAFFCWKTPIPKRKWLWMIFVLIGVGQLSFNWTTGASGFQPIAFVLFGIAYAQPPYGAAIVQIGFPLGALIFWLRRGKWLRAAQTSVPADAV